MQSSNLARPKFVKNMIQILIQLKLSHVLFHQEIATNITTETFDFPSKNYLVRGSGEVR